MGQYYSPTVGDRVEGSDRYSSVNVNRIRYPENNDGFVIPWVRFDFYDADSNRRATPEMFLQLPEQFRSSHQNQYSEAQYIFPGEGIFQMLKSAIGGPPVENSDGGEGDSGATAQTQSPQQVSAQQAFEYMLLKGGSAFSGFINSGGLSGIDQYEFANKKFVNPMQQLLYKGPTYRQFQMPFLMRPRNLGEAKSALAAVSMFKLAASTTPAGGLNIDVGSVFDTGISGFDADVGDFSSIPFTYEYPDLVKFTILVQNPNASNQLQQMFQSQYCAIVDLNVQYGSQRINFVEGEDNIYYPAEIAIDVTLKEVLYNTTKDYRDEALNANRTIR